MINIRKSISTNKQLKMIKRKLNNTEIEIETIEKRNISKNDLDKQKLDLEKAITNFQERLDDVNDSLSLLK